MFRLFSRGGVSGIKILDHGQSQIPKMTGRGRGGAFPKIVRILSGSSYCEELRSRGKTSIRERKEMKKEKKPIRIH